MSAPPMCCTPPAKHETTPYFAFFAGIIPSFLAYSSFDTSNRNLYAIMVVLTTAVQVISATVKWIREDKVRERLVRARLGYVLLL